MLSICANMLADGVLKIELAGLGLAGRVVDDWSPDVVVVAGVDDEVVVEAGVVVEPVDGVVEPGALIGKPSLWKWS